MSSKAYKSSPEKMEALWESVWLTEASRSTDDTGRAE